MSTTITLTYFWNILFLFGFCIMISPIKTMEEIYYLCDDYILPIRHSILEL